MPTQTNKPAKAFMLTLVIPVYNDENHLNACLESVQKQIIQPNKVIVVDNNSTDKSAAIARRFSFVTVITEKKQGVVHARNRGFDAVKKGLIARIDSDSVLPTDWTQKVMAFYANPAHAGQALTGGCYFYNIRFPQLTGWWQGQIAFRYNRLLMGHYILFGSNMVVPQIMWHKVRKQLCEDLDVHEDLDLAIHLHRINYHITYHETLKVGVAMKRVRSNRSDLWSNIMWWPKTLHRHGKKTWVFGWLGAVFFYAAAPLIPLFEWIAEKLGAPPLND